MKKKKRKKSNDGGTLSAAIKKIVDEHLHFPTRSIPQSDAEQPSEYSMGLVEGLPMLPNRCHAETTPVCILGVWHHQSIAEFACLLPDPAALCDGSIISSRAPWPLGRGWEREATASGLGGRPQHLTGEYQEGRRRLLKTLASRALCPIHQRKRTNVPRRPMINTIA